MQDLNSTWEIADNMLKSTKEIGSTNYRTWFSFIKPVALQGSTLYLSVPSVLHRNMLTDPDLCYCKYLKMVVNCAWSRELNVELILENEAKNYASGATAAASRPMLNEKYTFDTFVIGAGNQFAQAAALSVAESPAALNNPLFIYGGVGLGKTHLMHAIGNYILDTTPSMRVMYTTCEKYTNEFIDAIGKNRTAQFRAQYRNTVDVLMIDDIQFLRNKEKTQEELFHNINDLVNSNKQIIITSDRPPREIATLEDRLRSRFEGGLIVDVTPPDLETRVAILSLKAEACGAKLTNEMLFYIAERASDNVRELEGSLKRIVAYSTTMSRPITMELITEALRDYHTSAQRRITADKILESVASYFDIPTELLVGKKRDAAIVLPRHIAMYLCREHTDLSFPRIAEEFGGRDHATVIHGIGRIRQALKEDEKTRTYVEDIERRMQGI